MSKCEKCKYQTCLNCDSFYVPMMSDGFGCKRKDEDKPCYCDICTHQKRPRRENNFVELK